LKTWPLPLLLFGLFAAGSVAASEAAQCVSMSDPNARLNCYDAIFKVIEPPKTLGAWRVSEARSALDDSRTVTLRLVSDAVIAARFGPPQRAEMILRCMENKTAFYMTFADNFMADVQSYGRVDYRIDSLRADRWSMTESTDNKALGLWSGAGAIGAIKQMSAGKSLFVRVTPFNESPLEVTFTISGLDEAVKPLREACNW